MNTILQNSIFLIVLGKESHTTNTFEKRSKWGIKKKIPLVTQLRKCYSHVFNTQRNKIYVLKITSVPRITKVFPCI